jgi:hypothetical protein
VTNAPAARSGAVAVWDGYENDRVGGSVYTAGGLYDPVTDSWTVMSIVDQPNSTGTAVWTGSEMIRLGGRQQPRRGATIPALEFLDRDLDHTRSRVALGPYGCMDGIRDDRVGRKRLQLEFQFGRPVRPCHGLLDDNVGNECTQRPSGHLAVWEGSLMIVWGGRSASAQLNSGGIYFPSDGHVARNGRVPRWW